MFLLGSHCERLTHLPSLFLNLSAAHKHLGVHEAVQVVMSGFSQVLSQAMPQYTLISSSEHSFLQCSFGIQFPLSNTWPGGQKHPLTHSTLH